MGNQVDATNYYEVLEVQADAPAHEVHRAYQRAKSTYSQDNPALYSMFSAEEARELLRLIEEAYTVLGNPGLRKSYDDARSRGEIVHNGPLRQQNYQQAVTVDTHGGPANHAPAPPITIHTPIPHHQQHSHATPTTYSQPMHQASAAFKENPKDIISVHQALPDFSTPTGQSAKASEGGRTTSSGPKAMLAPGMGKTQLSTYKIDENFEAELSGALDWDGALLQRARLYKNISIDSLSEATRISRSYLMAVETNDFKALPAAVFVRGFVVQMARYLGLPDNKVATSYIKIFKAGGGK